MGTQNQNGSSLIEVMVALFVLAIGLLGMVSMQTKSMQYNQTAYTYSQAAYLATDMAERIRNNSGVAASYVTDKTEKAANKGTCNTVACSPANLAVWDLAVWGTNLDAYLPGGNGSIEVVNTGDAGPHLVVTVAFFDGRVATEAELAEDDGELQKYSLVVEI